MTTSTAMDGDRAGQERSDNGPGIVFCWCPAGSFRMGSDDVYDTLERTFVPADVVAAHEWPPRPREEAAGESGASADEDGSDPDEDEGDEDDDPTGYWAMFGDEAPVDVTCARVSGSGNTP